MAVMAFGMMAIVGLQSTLRLNSDVSKQRSEAVRIAEEAIEDWRAFSSCQPGPTSRPTTTSPSVRLDDNAVDRHQRHLHAEANGEPGQGWKSIQVEVSWVDRTGQPQSVTLSSVIAGADPALSGVLSTVPARRARAACRWPAPRRLPGGRDLGGGKSAYRPPGAPKRRFGSSTT